MYSYTAELGPQCPDRRPVLEGIGIFVAVRVGGVGMHLSVYLGLVVALAGAGRDQASREVFMKALERVHWRLLAGVPRVLQGRNNRGSEV